MANSVDNDSPRFEIPSGLELAVFIGPSFDSIESNDALITKHFNFSFEDWISDSIVDLDSTFADHHASYSRDLRRHE